MKYEKIIQQINGRWQYIIVQYETPIIVQDWDPEEAGFVPMDEARAAELADIVLHRLTSEEGAHV